MVVHFQECKTTILRHARTLNQTQCFIQFNLRKIFSFGKKIVERKVSYGRSKRSRCAALFIEKMKQRFQILLEDEFVFKVVRLPEHVESSAKLKWYHRIGTAKSFSI